MADPIIVIVEDCSTWRRELARMYTSILRGASAQKSDGSFHKNIKTFATIEEALHFLEEKKRSNGRSQFDILSLDLRLGGSNDKLSGKKDTSGVTFVDKAVEYGNQFVTIVVSGAHDDSEFKNRLSADKQMQNRFYRLESVLQEKTKCKVFRFSKYNKRERSIKEQVRDIEEILRSKTKAKGNPLRTLAKELREPSGADFNGKCICLHFRLPQELYGVNKKFVAGSLLPNTQDELLVYQNDLIFSGDDWKEEPIDYSVLLTRLLFLADPGKKGYYAGISLQDTPEQPAPEDDWLDSTSSSKQLFARQQVCDLLILMVEGWDRLTNSTAESHTGQTSDVYEQEMTLAGTLNGWVGARSRQYKPDQNLSLEVSSKDGSTNALTTRVSRLREALDDLSHGLGKMIPKPEKRYTLEIPGQVFIHRGD